MKAAAG